MKVLITTPTQDTKLDAYYVHSSNKSMELARAHGHEVNAVYWPGEALVQHARNALAQIAVHSGVDKIFMIDADQEWGPEQFLRIINNPCEVVGATYRRKTDEEQYTVRVTQNFRLNGGIEQVLCMGTGFLCVSREALKAVWDASEPYAHSDGQTYRNIFEVGVIDGKLYGEDTVFCEKLVQAGFPVYLDSTFTVGHNGYKRYKGNFRAYVERLTVGV